MSAVDNLHRYCTKAMDRIGREHRSGHQNVHARRYVVIRDDGSMVETVIIVQPASNLQIWCEAKVAAPEDAMAFGGKLRPGSETYVKTNAKGEKLYGRHSSLKTMDYLHRGDAYHFSPKSPVEVDRIINLIVTGAK